MKIITVLFIILLVFAPGVAKSEEAKDGHKYYILVSVEDCKLWLYQLDNSEKPVLVKEYSVSTVKSNAAYYPLGQGVVTEIAKKPYWYPTESIKEAFAKRGISLPDSVPPGDPLNYMGSFKISLSHSVPGKGSIYRIHGTRAEDREKIGKRVSSGCIRMFNEEGEELASKIKVGTIVNIVMKKN